MGGVVRQDGTEMNGSIRGSEGLRGHELEETEGEE